MSTDCSVPNCDRPHQARGYCLMHYKRWRKHGDANVVLPKGLPKTITARLGCSIADCLDEAVARGWCEKHYTRWRRHGDPTVNLTGYGIPAADRFWSNVSLDGDCWAWTAGKTAAGYGSFNGGGSGLAHRFAYEQMVGEIPAGLELDHLCRNRACVNPEHLDPVTTRVNSVRGVEARLGDRCSRGHLFPVVEIGARRCMVCRAAARRSRYARKKTAS